MSYGKAKQSAASKSDVWETPKALVEALKERFGPFVLDAAASPENAKAPRFFTEKDDALKQDWVGDLREPGVVFCNPPYSRGNKPRFVEKALRTAQDSRRGVVMVLPATMGEKWFHAGLLEDLYAFQDKGFDSELVYDGPLRGFWIRGRGLGGLRVQMGFLKGRVKFISPLNPKGNSSPGGTCVVAFLP